MSNGVYHRRKFRKNLRPSRDFPETFRQQCCPHSDVSSEATNCCIENKSSFIEPREGEKNSSLCESLEKRENFLKSNDLLGLGDCNRQATHPEPKKKSTRITRSGKIYCTF